MPVIIITNLTDMATKSSTTPKSNKKDYQKEYSDLMHGYSLDHSVIRDDWEKAGDMYVQFSIYDHKNVLSFTSNLK